MWCALHPPLLTLTRKTRQRPPRTGGADGKLMSLPGRLAGPITRLWQAYQFKKQALIHAGATHAPPSFRAFLPFTPPMSTPYHTHTPPRPALQEHPRPRRRLPQGRGLREVDVGPRRPRRRTARGQLRLVRRGVRRRLRPARDGGGDAEGGGGHLVRIHGCVLSRRVGGR